MVTAVLYSLLAITGAAFLFAVLSNARGSRFAYLAICWLPLGGLFLAVGAHHHLGFAMIGVLAAIVAASIAIVSLGVYLCATALRDKSAMRSLVWGTLIAATPLLILLLRS